MREGQSLILVGLAALAFCGLMTYVFGWPDIGRQVTNFAALILIAIPCLAVGCAMEARRFFGKPMATKTVLSNAVSTTLQVPQNFGRKATAPPLSSGPSFSFEHFDRYSFVDQANELKLRIEGGPDYQDLLVLERRRKRETEDSLERKNAYFKFSVSIERSYGLTAHRISSASIGTPFEEDYPGRSEELLDAILPIVCEVYAKLTGSPIREFGAVPAELRPLLRQQKSYYWKQPGAGW
jgi:hypothetical protein